MLCSAAVTGGIEAGLVGLAISYVLRVGNRLNWLVRNVADAEMQMASVERVNHYASLKSEKYGGRQQQHLLVVVLADPVSPDCTLTCRRPILCHLTVP